jgi:hypothetical protein
MEKKYQIIYIWSFIIISGIVLLLLYTPLGGDIHYAAYNEQDRYSVSPGVNYSSQIGSLSNGGSGGNSSYGYYSAPSQYSSPTFQGTSSASSSSLNSVKSTNGYSSSGITTRSSKTKTGSGGGSSASGVLGMSKSKESEVNNTFNGGSGFGGTLVNTTQTPNVIQRGTTEDGDPLDPGGDPTGNPLPIGNELGVLFSLALIFSIYKWRAFKK